MFIYPLFIIIAAFISDVGRRLTTQNRESVGHKKLRAKQVDAKMEDLAQRTADADELLAKAEARAERHDRCREEGDRGPKESRES